jgi:hypothetical protein
MENKFEEKIRDFVNREISDYSYFENSKLVFDEGNSGDGVEYYYLEFNGLEKVNDVHLRCSKKEKERILDKSTYIDIVIEVELGEEIWYETCEYTWDVKYFWMALLW